MSLRNTAVSAVLLGVVGGVFVFAGHALTSSTGGAALGVVVGVVVAGASCLLSDRLAIRGVRAVPVSEADQPTLYRIVRELSQQAGLPMPRLYVVPSAQPNAFSTGRSPRHAAVAVTAGLLPLLDDDELRGVLAHELAHVRNRDILIGSVATGIAMWLTFLARITLWSTLLGRRRRADPLSLVLVLAAVVLAPLAALLLRLSLCRTREYHADWSGARLAGDGEPLARALAKLGQASARIPMQVDAAHASAYIVDPLRWARDRLPLAALMVDHPPVEQRVARLRAYGEPRA